MSQAKKSSAVRKIIKSKWFVLLVITVLVLLTVYRTVVFVNHKKDQKLLLEDLEKSSEILDGIVNDFKKDLPVLDPVRHEYCYRASRKFEEGPIYCGQSVEIQVKNLSKTTYAEHVNYFKKYFEKNEELSFKKNDSFKNNVGYYAKTNHKNGGCSVIIMPEARYLDYDLQIECLSSEFDSFIYPERSNR